MDTKVLLAKLLKGREKWVTLEPGKRVLLRRPPECEVGDLPRGTVHAGVTAYTVGWDGITEDDLVGTGCTDAVPFVPELWAALVADRSEWLALAWDELVDMCNARFEQRRIALGNSKSTSTQQPPNEAVHSSSAGG